MGVVDIDTSTSTAELYRNYTTGVIYTDSTLKTALTASVEGESNPVQVKALLTDTVTFGGKEFLRLTAGGLNVKDNKGNQIIWDGINSEPELVYNISYVVDGTPEVSSMLIVNVAPEEPPAQPSESTPTTNPNPSSEPNPPSEDDAGSGAL